MIVQDNDLSGESGRRHREAVLAAVKTRVCRSYHMPAEWFSDPAWDILIELYAKHMGLPFDVTNALLPIDAMPPRLERWAKLLESEGIATRRDGPFRLTAKGVESMHACIEEIARQVD